MMITLDIRSKTWERSETTDRTARSVAEMVVEVVDNGTLYAVRLGCAKRQVLTGMGVKPVARYADGDCVFVQEEGIESAKCDARGEWIERPRLVNTPVTVIV